MRGLALMLLVSLLSAAPANLAVEPISRMQVGWWRQRFLQKQSELENKVVNVVWLGDSITQDWDRDGPSPWLRFRPIWDHYYSPLGSVNLGFKGDSTCHVLWRLLHGEMDSIRPKVVIMLIGANNFGHVHTDADQTFQGIRAILALLHHRWPHAKLVLIGVLPSIRSAWVDENTKRLNEKLSAFSAHLDYIDFVDARKIFLQHGAVDPSKFLDPRLTPPQPALHPTAQAQAEIAAMIAPLVTRDLGMNDHP